MTVHGSLLVNGPTEVQGLQDACWGEFKVLADQGAKDLVGDFSRPLGVDHDRDRLGDPDCISELHLAFVRQPGSNDVLGDIAGHIRGGPVNFGRILPRIAPTAMTSHPAVRIDDDLPARKSRITLRPPGHEPARRINVVDNLFLV